MRRSFLLSALCLFAADMNAELAAPEVLERLNVFGFEPSPGTPEQLAEAIRADMKTYGELVRLTGATAD